MEQNNFTNNIGYNLKDKSSILIKSGRIVDPVLGKEFISDIYIKNGLIETVSKDIKVEGNNVRNNKNLIVIDASKYLVCPGFVDIHVHLREPGNEDEEDLESGVKAALKGGITTMSCMPNTNPPVDSEYMVKYIIGRAKKIGYKIYPVASMTKKLEGKQICEFGILSQAGAVAFSDDGKCVTDSKLMYEIMRYAYQFELPLILHEEDYSFSEYGLVNEGYYSSALGLAGISSLSEELIVSRDITLAKYTKAKIHITHVSSKASLDLIRKAKEDGVDITCDVTPHHLFFNDSYLSEYNTNFKVNPPLRSELDRQAIIEGIKEGVVDAVASDHAPHLEVEKNTTFREASFGAIGLETLFKACYTKLYKEEKIKLSKIISLITYLPAKILNLDVGRIEAGKRADVTIIDADRIDRIKEDDFVSKSKNSPFIGESLQGEVVCTINEGRLEYINKRYKL